MTTRFRVKILQKWYEIGFLFDSVVFWANFHTWGPIEARKTPSVRYRATGAFPLSFCRSLGRFYVQNVSADVCKVLQWVVFWPFFLLFLPPSWWSLPFFSLFDHFPSPSFWSSKGEIYSSLLITSLPLPFWSLPFPFPFWSLPFSFLLIIKRGNLLVPFDHFPPLPLLITCLWSRSAEWSPKGEIYLSLLIEGNHLLRRKRRKEEPFNWKGKEREKKGKNPKKEIERVHFAYWCGGLRLRKGKETQRSIVASPQIVTVSILDPSPKKRESRFRLLTIPPKEVPRGE